MAESMAASVKLTLESSIATGVARGIAALESLDRQIAKSQDGLGKLAADMDRVGKGAAGMERAAKAMQRVNDSTAGAGNVSAVADAMDRVSGGAAEMERTAAAYERVVRAGRSGGGAGGGSGGGGGGSSPPAYTPRPGGSVPNYTPPVSPWGSPAPAANSHEMDSGTAVAVGAAGYGLFDVLKGSMNAATDVRSARAALLALGYTAAQADAAEASAYQDQQQLHEISVVDALKARATLKRVTGSADVAESTARDFEISAFVMSKNGGGDIAGTIDDAAKAGELKGVVNDPAKLTAFLHNIVLLDQMTGHTMSPHTELQLLRNSGIAGAYGTSDSMINELPAMLSMGPTQAGTAMQRFAQQWAAGKMSVASAEEAVKLGIIPAGSWHKAGMGQVRLDNGAIDATQVLHDPTKVVDYISGKIHDYNIATYGEDNDVLQAVAAYRVGTSVGASKFDADIERTRAMRSKYQGVADQLRQFDPAYVKATNDPKVAQIDAFNAVTALQARAGDSSVGQWTTFLHNVKAASDWLGNVFVDHPVAANAGLNLAGVVAAAASGAAAGAFVGPLGAGGGAVLGASGAALVEMLGTKDGPNHIATALFPFFSQFEALINRLFPTGSNGGLKLDTSQALHVHVDNAGDLANGIDQHLAAPMTGPPTGPTGHDPQIIGTHPGH